MKAIVCEKYGGPEVLEMREVEKPTPKENEVLVRVRASSVNPAEWYAMTGIFIARLMGGGLTKPKEARLGTDFSGVVEAVGSAITQFKPGDEVFGGRSGAFAEYVCKLEETLMHKPANVTFEQAAAVPIAAITALQGLRDYGQIQPGQKVLINGASGGVGTFAVQIAKALGAEVTGVCSTRNVELVRSLGADVVVDYKQEDFTRRNEKYDLLLDNAGTRSWAEYKRVLKPNARFVVVGAPKGNPWIGPLSHVLKVRLGALGASQKLLFFIAKFNRADLLVLRDMLAAGKVKPVVERTYPLAQISEAMRYLGTGHAQGKIVVTIGVEGKS